MISVDCKPLRFDCLGNGSRHISHPDLQKVRRVLFGPVDHQDNERFVKTELEKHMTFSSRKWNFDFSNEKTLDPKGVYIWKAEVHAQQVRPVKRKREETYDTSDLYFDASSVRSKSKEAPKQTQKKSEAKQSKAVGAQRRMTDYLVVKKHSTVEATKKVKPVPIKKPRLTAS